MPDIQDHPEYRALMAAVRADLADDLPRLVLADWLEEHEHPRRAAFIRVQCEAERLKVELTGRRNIAEGQRWITLTDRERVLLKTEAAGWALALFPHTSTWEPTISGDLVNSLGIKLKISRGFLVGVTCPLIKWTGGRCLREQVTSEGMRWCRCCGKPESVAAGPRAVREHLVTRFGASDRTPWQDRDGRYRWEEETESLTHQPAALRSHLMPYLGRTRSYPTHEAAVDALSEAAIAWASEQPVPAAP